MDEKFTIKDSGQRVEFSSGMVRDTSTGKVRYNRVLEGPMFKRWAIHLMRGAVKYPDVRPGVANWTLADGPEELQRFKESALSHLIQWLLEERDEDHAAGVIFNINGAEYVKEKLDERPTRNDRAFDLQGAARSALIRGAKVEICYPCHEPIAADKQEISQQKAQETGDFYSDFYAIGNPRGSYRGVDKPAKIQAGNQPATGGSGSGKASSLD